MSKKEKRRNEYIHSIPNAELSSALSQKLTAAELVTLERQIRHVVTDAVEKAVVTASENAYKRFYTVTIRVLQDRHSFDQEQITRFWDASMDYIHDLDEGILTLDDITKTLNREDIEIEWEII